PARARSVEGSGIGLALVQRLVAAQDGTVTVDSEVGVGTRVTILLPAFTATPDANQAVVPARSAAYVSEAFEWVNGDEERAARRDGRRLILIADDNADMRRHLQRVLGTYWDTVAVADGEAALDEARRLHPDLVLTDVMMPTLDGFDLAAAIRRDAELASLPVIMLSARAGVEASGDGLAGGADDYLVKPFSSAELISRVTARLESSARARASGGHRVTEFAELSAAINAATTLEGALEAVLESPVGAPGAISIALATPDRATGLVRIRFAGSLRRDVIERYHLVGLDAPVPIVDVLASGVPMIVEETRHLATRYSPDPNANERACVIEPLRGQDGYVTGAVSFNWALPRSFTPDDLAALRRTADVIGGATDRIRSSEREHRVATELQERLLDLDVRSTQAVVSAAYQPAAEMMRIGGDWYTATTLDDGGRVGVSVGDVVGKGLPAATVMSQLRSALGAAALTVGDPGAVVSLVERYAESVDGAVCATVAYAVIDAQAESLTYACAGHPYPLVVMPGGDVQYLRGGRRPPLGAQGRRPPEPSERAAFPPGSLLVLYTDGLVERHGEPLDGGLDRLAAAAASCASLPVGAACDELLRRMTPPGGYSDDVALVAVRPVGTT
ncbi:MAG TPA: SpoIIE family protein phosphatase, partial [Acidimicrobiales bacterium]|nr:SpoIIE family protein phosphatase [Acidimicrobiales bacterium]